MRERKDEPDTLAMVAATLGSRSWGVSRYSFRGYLICVSWFFNIAFLSCIGIFISSGEAISEFFANGKLFVLIGVVVGVSLVGPLVFGLVVYGLLIFSKEKKSLLKRRSSDPED
ncbi:MAG: hypothetical protein AAFN07_15855 [Pseudomonadota bacterium]